jgi:hypothetical protein
MRSTDLVVGEHIRQKQNYVAMFLWVFLSFFYVSLISQWLTINIRDKLLSEYINRVIQVEGHEQRSAKEVRALILIKAGDLLLPVQGDEIQINGSGQSLKAAVHYKADISMPIVNQPVYQLSFRHELSH